MIRNFWINYLLRSYGILAWWVEAIVRVYEDMVLYYEGEPNHKHTHTHI